MRRGPRWLAFAGVLELVTASGVAAVPGVVAVAPPVIQHEPMMPAPSRTPVNTSIDNIGWGSTNWSGYAISGNRGAYSAGTGCWEVPAVPVTSPGASFYAVPSLRICDTRSAPTTGYTTECSGDTLGSGQVLPIEVAGVDGIPAAGGSSPPVAVIAHVTAVSGTSFTYFTLYPADSPSTPNTSHLNVDAQQNTPNLTIVQLAQTGAHVGAVDLYNRLGSIKPIVDVAGWFQ